MQQDRQLIQPILFLHLQNFCCTEQEVGGPTAGVIDPRSRIWTTGGKIVVRIRAKPVPGQNNSTNPTSKFGAGITGYVGD
jgi:hypothetical protein